MKYVIGLVLAIVLVAVSACGGEATPAPTAAPVTPKPKIKWDFSTVQKLDSWEGRVSQEFVREVLDRTGGGLEIVIHPSSELYKGTEVMRVLRDKLLPTAEIFPPYVAGDEHVMGWASLPFLISPDQIDRVGEQVHSQVIFPLLDEKWNTQVLWTTYSYTQQIITEKSLRTVADLKGVKIRVASRELAALLEKAGASPIFLPWAEAIPALERGTVDAISTGWSGIVEWKIYDIVDNIWVMDLNVFPIYWAVNKQALAELPAEYRDALLQVSKEFNEKLKTEWRAAELELRATAEKEVNVVDIAPAEKAKLIALAKPVWDEWATEDALSRQALDVALATLK